MILFPSSHVAVSSCHKMRSDSDAAPQEKRKTVEQCVQRWPMQGKAAGELEMRWERSGTIKDRFPTSGPQLLGSPQ